MRRNIPEKVDFVDNFYIMRHIIKNHGFLCKRL
jgi:hypothetical protein